MNINWQITQNDIDTVKSLIAANQNPFVQARYLKNVAQHNLVINKDTVLKTMLMCLLTSQQPSGPNSAIAQFLRRHPFPVRAEVLATEAHVEHFIKETLQQSGLIRYLNRISSFFAANYRKCTDSNWQILNILYELKNSGSRAKEREVADYLHQELHGFGPKQSRNFLQSMGLTKYEIPIDSRVMNWLNSHNFPVPLSASALGDKGYYHFVLDGIQELCKKAEIYPCILDAALFSSIDKKEWSEEAVF